MLKEIKYKILTGANIKCNTNDKFNFMIKTGQNWVFYIAENKQNANEY